MLILSQESWDRVSYSFTYILHTLCVSSRTNSSTLNFVASVVSFYHLNQVKSPYPWVCTSLRLDDCFFSWWISFLLNTNLLIYSTSDLLEIVNFYHIKHWLFANFKQPFLSYRISREMKSVYIFQLKSLMYHFLFITTLTTNEETLFIWHWNLAFCSINK